MERNHYLLLQLGIRNYELGVLNFELGVLNFELGVSMN